MESLSILKVIFFVVLASCVSAQRQVYRQWATSKVFYVSPSPEDLAEVAPSASRGREQQGLVPLEPSPDDSRFSVPIASVPAGPPARSFEAVTQAPQVPTLFPTLFPLPPAIAALFGLPQSPAAGSIGSPGLLAPPASAGLPPARIDQAPAPVYAGSQQSGGLPYGQQYAVDAGQGALNAPVTPLPFLLTLPPSLAALFGIPTAVGNGAAAPVGAQNFAPSRPAAFAAPIASSSQFSAQQYPQAYAVDSSAYSQEKVVYPDQAPVAAPTPAPFASLFTLPPSLAALFGIPTAQNAAPVGAAQSAPLAFGAPLAFPSAPLALPGFAAPVAAPTSVKA